MSRRFWNTKVPVWWWIIYAAANHVQNIGERCRIFSAIQTRIPLQMIIGNEFLLAIRNKQKIKNIYRTSIKWLEIHYLSKELHLKETVLNGANDQGYSKQLKNQKHTWRQSKAASNIFKFFVSNARRRGFRTSSTSAPPNVCPAFANEMFIVPLFDWLACSATSALGTFCGSSASPPVFSPPPSACELKLNII